MPAPVNDNFANAIDLGSAVGSLLADNTGATTEVGEPTDENSSTSIWYKYTPTRNIRLRIKTVLDGTLGDSVIAVYSGSSLGSLTLLESNDDYIGDLFSQVFVDLVAGTTYYIWVGGYSTNVGTFHLEWDGHTPNHDDFADAYVITNRFGSAVLVTEADNARFATIEASEPIPSVDTEIHRTVWATWTPTFSGKVVLSITGSKFFDSGSGPYDLVNTIVTAYTGSSLATLAEVASSESTGLTFTVVSGTTYYIQIGTWSDYTYYDPQSYVLNWAPDASSMIPAAVMPNNDGWFIDHMNHDLSVYQTYRPETLHFTKRLGEPEDADWEISNSALDVNGDLIVGRTEDGDDFFRPWERWYKLRHVDSGVSTTVMAGPITKTNLARGRDYVKVMGRDWMEYLDRRMIPFNPEAPDDFLFDTEGLVISTARTPPPQSLTYQVYQRDVVNIIKDILRVVMDRPYSLPEITCTEDPIGTLINLQLPLGGIDTLYNIFNGLSDHHPGFDWRIGVNDRKVRIWKPTRFGDPDTTVDDGPAGGNISWTFGDDFGFSIYDVDFTNSGARSTHLFGMGAGMAASRIGRALGASDAQTQWGRLDGSKDFGDQAKSRDTMNMRTRKEFIYQVQALHEIPLVVDPRSIPNFWNAIKVGYAIWLRENLQLHRIDSPQQIISIDCTVNNEGDELATLDLNQIYHTTTHYGVVQG